MNLIDSRQPDYASYLLRVRWDNTHRRWRASLQCTATQQSYHFVTLEALFVFLAAQLVGDADAAAAREAPPQG